MPFIIPRLVAAIEFLLCKADGKLDFKAGRFVSSEDKRPSDVIKTGTEMMNNLPREHRKSQGDSLWYCGERALHGFIVDMSNDDIVVRMGEGSDFGPENS